MYMLLVNLLKICIGGFGSRIVNFILILYKKGRFFGVVKVVKGKES